MCLRAYIRLSLIVLCWLNWCENCGCLHLKVGLAKWWLASVLHYEHLVFQVRLLVRSGPRSFNLIRLAYWHQIVPRCSDITDDFSAWAQRIAWHRRWSWLRIEMQGLSEISFVLIIAWKGDDWCLNRSFFAQNWCCDGRLTSLKLDLVSDDRILQRLWMFNILDDVLHVEIANQLGNSLSEGLSSAISLRGCPLILNRRFSACKMCCTALDCYACNIWLLSCVAYSTLANIFGTLSKACGFFAIISCLALHA